MADTQQVIYSMVGVGRVYPPEKQVLRDISLGFFYGAKIGVLGLNGSGKSTLLRIMAGVDADYLGEIHRSEGYAAGLLEQEPRLDPEKTVKEVVEEAVQPLVDLMRRYEEVCDAFADEDADIDALGEEQGRLQEELDKHDVWDLDQRLEVAMEALRCPPGDTPVRVLSGGERNRVHLAKMLKRGANLLLLDEPTNDLDVNTLRALEEALESFAGCLVVVSHDRWFLDRVATHTLAFEEDGGIRWFEGSFSDYEADRKKRLGSAADMPHRLRHRRLQR